MKIHHYKEVETDNYVAAFNTWGKNLRNGLIHDIRAWCTQAYGPTSNNDDSRWKDDIIWGEVRFRDEADLVAFLLRWS